MFERKKPSGKLLSLPIDQIHPSPFQARKSFDEQELTALAQSIRENGLLQPVTVRFANKLRLLQLTADQRQFVLDNNLTERHARAVLRLPENRRSEALITIAKRRLNARQTDSYIEQLLNSPPKAGHRISMVRDVRIFVNTIDHAIRLMTDNGVPATAHREEKDGYIEYTVRIPTAAAEK